MVIGSAGVRRSSDAPDDTDGTPECDVKTNWRRCPSSRSHTTGLLESTAPGNSISGALTRNARGVPAEPDTTFAVIIATTPTVAARTKLITSSIHETFRVAISCLYYAYRSTIVSAILCGVSPVVTDVLDPVLDDVLDVDLLERAWQGTSDIDEKSISKINKAQLTI